jgi:excisionase family DNA binding protein
MSGERLLTVAQLAAHWGWSQQKIRALVRAGEIPHLRLGRRHNSIHFRESVIDAWLHSREVAPVSAAIAASVAIVTREDECRRLGIPVDHAFS